MRPPRWLWAGPAVPLLLCISVRAALPLAAWLFHRDGSAFVTGDGSHYIALARHLLEKGTYGTRALGTETFRPPGYPLLLAIAMASGFTVPAALALNVILGGIATYLAYRIGRHLGGARAGWWAGVLCGCEPGQVIWGSYVLAESALAACATLCAWLGILSPAQRTAGRFAAVGVAGAITAFVKTIGYFLAGWLALLIALLGAQGLRRRAGAALAVLLPAVLLLGAWQVRNWYVAGYGGFATQMDATFLFAFGAGAIASRDGIEFDEARRLEKSRFGIAPRGVYSLQRSQAEEMRARAVTLLKDSPLIALMVHLRGMLVVMFSATYPLEDVLRLSGHALNVTPEFTVYGLRRAAQKLVAAPGRIILEKLVRTAVFAIPLLGYWYCAGRAVWEQRRSRSVLYLVGLAVYFVFCAGGPFAEARFRVPIMPILAVLAGLHLSRRAEAHAAAARPQCTHSA